MPHPALVRCMWYGCDKVSRKLYEFSVCNLLRPAPHTLAQPLQCPLPDQVFRSDQLSRFHPAGRGAASSMRFGGNAGLRPGALRHRPTRHSLSRDDRSSATLA